MIDLAAKQLNSILDWSHTELVRRPDGAPQVITALSRELRQMKLHQTGQKWMATIAQCRNHPLRLLLHEDPLTQRAYTQPRGYQGDAELLDIIYRKDWRGLCGRPVSPLGEAIFRHTIQCKAPQAVRTRADILATTIDEVSRLRPSPHIFSVACGHLREALKAESFRSGAVGRFVGLDHDALSLKVVEQDLGPLTVETVQGSVKLILNGAFGEDKFDFIYAAGLYDYLQDRFARRLTEKLFGMLRAGGRLLVANYLPSIEDVGFMEAYMNWQLIYRDADAMRQLADGIPESEKVSCEINHAAEDTIVLMRLDRV